ncbi:hypothetical protein PXC01_08515 [Maribacter sp. M208]|uniref:hypothetical protein n=1 Tax=Maribacter huludaoensis TaxID=3030010 RepID=UPI0023ED162F|nr:hypothetical protein [Maribacter huludaoensis]MDF4221625.1 hypothetical protein [Maribacter huludaoensis]
MTTKSEKEKILKNIDKYEWAKSLVEQLHSQVDSTVLSHSKNPELLLSSIPKFASSDHQNNEKKAGPIAAAHNKILRLAANSGMLYYLTANENYAQLSADILNAYFEHISPLTPETTSICGYAFFDPRTTYDQIAIAYDFIYEYLKKPGTTVYDNLQGTQVAFNNNKAQMAIKNIVGNVLQEYGEPDVYGKRISNHPILTAPGALFAILCVEDDTERERLFHIFWETGTAHQNSFTRTILPMFSSQGIWPESLSYSFMPIITMVLNIVDRVKPEMNVTENNRHIFEGNFLFDYLRNPDRTFVRYGDSKRYNDFTAPLYRYTLRIADRRGFTSLKEKAEVALQQSYRSQGGYRPDLGQGNIFNNYNALQLFWGLPLPEAIDKTVDLNKPTVIVDHAGIALQRNYVKTDNELYGLCGIIGGAHYVHSHLTGITMELYGAGYIMGPNAGLPPTVSERQIPLHEHYFRLYAGNNTVIVNGTSHGLDEGSWKRKANVWQNTTVNIAAEPKHLEDPISKEFSFATQYLNDTVNDAQQERTLGIIRTSDSTGYYFDMFRSKSNIENKFHDYVYHNIGDKTVLTNEKGKALSVQQTDRYKNDIGDIVKSPGWRYFEDTKSTKSIKETVKVRFDVNYNKRYMHMIIPKESERAYTTALAPGTREAKNGYVDKQTQVLIIRQKGEAWENPFISIFEPSTNKKSSIQKVETLKQNGQTVGAIIISKVGKSLITDYIICQDTEKAQYQSKKSGISFQGRFAIVRTTIEDDKTENTLYIGDGKKLLFGGKKLETNGNTSAVLHYNP